jgi:4-amino-4-deoxy-L-arabinose transferase-like glycosyltransferase
VVLAAAVALSGCTAQDDPMRRAGAAPWPPRQELLESAVRIPCETAAIDVGDASWRPLLAGFYGDETWNEEGEARSFAWAGPAADVSLLISETGRREIVLTARAAMPVVVVTASLDGQELGTRQIPDLWSEIRWPIPAEIAIPGPHRLRLVASESKQFDSDPRTLSFAVDRLELSSPARCAGAIYTMPPKELDEGGRLGGPEIELSVGEALVAPVSLPPGGRLKVGVAGSSNAELQGYVLHRGGLQSLGFGGTSATARSTDGRLFEWAVPGCCQPEAAIVLVVRSGESPVRVTALAVEGDPSTSAWRRACSLPAKAAAAVIVLLVGGGFLLRELRRRNAAPTVAPPLATVWRDAAVIAAVAVAVRLLFLEIYPEPGRSADAYEYLMRSARLAEGRVSFLRDTGWHAWQTWSRPPGYYLFLAAIRELGGELISVLRLQGLACGVAAGATYLAGCRLFGRLAGWVAGLGFALYAESVVTFSRVLSEPLYMLFVVPALAALTWASVRPSGPLAASAGVLFGLGALVRSAPIWYVPLAAMTLLASTGPRRGWRPALVLIGSFAVVVTPWAIRNAAIAGAPAGIDNLVVVNLLQVRPNDRFVPHSDLDLATPEGWRTYYTRLKQGNSDGALSSRGGEILRATLADLAAEPGAAVASFGSSLGAHFALYEFDFFSRTHREDDLCRVRWVTDLLNFQHVMLFALGAVGLLLTARDRRSWPLALWFFFNTVVINLLFHPEPKYRLPTMPVVVIWAGAAVAILVHRVTRGPSIPEKS